MKDKKDGNGNDNGKSYLLIEIDKKTRSRFREYCKGQNVSLKLGLTTLMRSAIRRNVKIIHRVAI